MTLFARMIRLGAAALVLFAAASLALAQSTPVPVRAIHVTGARDPIMAEIAHYVAQALASQLGPRYAPGARGGATLTVHLTDYDLPNGDDGDFDDSFGRRLSRGGPTIDLLEGSVTLRDGRGRALSSFPLTATTTAAGASVMNMRPPVYRLRGLAGTYAHWVVRKLR